MISNRLKILDSVHGDLPQLAGRTICWTKESCDHALAAGQRAVIGATDIETIPYKKPPKMQVEQALPDQCQVFAMTVVAYTFLRPDGMMESFAFPLLQSKDIKSGPVHGFAYIYQTIRKLNDLDLKYTLHNGVYDCHWLIFYRLPIRNYAYDSMTMFWSIWPDLPKRLDFVSSILLDHYRYWKGGRKEDDYVEYMAYAMSDTEYTLANTIVLARMLILDSSCARNFFHAHMRCLSGLCMSFFGLAVDEGVMHDLGEKLQDEAERSLARARYVVGSDTFNQNSPKQRDFLVYELFGARTRSAKGKPIGKDGKRSTGRMALQAIRNDHPLFRRVIDPILEAVTPAKQISNVVKMPRFPAGPSRSRFICSYDGVGTTTTRYSCRGSVFGHGSNAQNIRKDYRKFAMADSHSFFIEIDFSAADDVFVGFESNEPKKIELIRSGKDGHATNALIFFSNWTYDLIVFGKNSKNTDRALYDRVTHPITGVRQITKKLVHGGHYLMAGATLLASAGREAIVAAALEEGHLDAGYWSQEKLIRYCELLDAKFRNHYPRFQREQAGPVSWYYDLRKEVIATGGFTTWNKYFQRFLSSPYEDSTLRAVAATAGQAGTAGRVNMVMDELVHGFIPKFFRDGPNPHAGAEPRRVSEALNGITIRLQTHDSIAFNVNYDHPRWEDGIAVIFESFSRPCVIRDEVFNVGWEADMGIYWADENEKKVKTLDEIKSNVQEISLASKRIWFDGYGNSDIIVP